MPYENDGIQGAFVVSGGVPVQQQMRNLGIVCTVGGNVAMTFPDGSSMTVPVSSGLTILPFNVAEVLTSGTTVSGGVYYGLK